MIYALPLIMLTWFTSIEVIHKEEFINIPLKKHSLIMFYSELLTVLCYT